MNTETKSLTSKIVETVHASRVAADVTDVSVEPDTDNDGIAFLRVKVTLKDTQKADDDDLDALLEDIEEAVLEIDDRYPSVRFLDAA